MGAMNGVVPKGEHERLIAIVLLYERNRLVGQFVGQVTLLLVSHHVGVLEVGRMVGTGMAPVGGPYLPIEALVDGVVWLVAQMPFSDEEVVITKLLQHLGIGCVLKRQPVDAGELGRILVPQVERLLRPSELIKPIRGIVRDVPHQLEPCGVFPREQRAATGAASRAGNVGLLEIKPFVSKPVNVGRFEYRIPIPQIRPSHVIHEEQYDIGLIYRQDIDAQ